MTGPAGLSEADGSPGDDSPAEHDAGGAPGGPATRDEVTVEDPGGEQTPAEVLEQARDESS